MNDFGVCDHWICILSLNSLIFLLLLLLDEDEKNEEDEEDVDRLYFFFLTHGYKIKQVGS